MACGSRGLGRVWLWVRAAIPGTKDMQYDEFRTQAMVNYDASGTSCVDIRGDRREGRQWKIVVIYTNKDLKLIKHFIESHNCSIDDRKCKVGKDDSSIEDMFVHWFQTNRWILTDPMASRVDINGC